MATQFIMSHNSFGKSLSPPSGVDHPGQNKPSARSSALKKVERLRKTRKDRWQRGGQDYRRKRRKCRKWIACVAWRFLSNLSALRKRRSRKEPGRETTEKPPARHFLLVQYAGVVDQKANPSIKIIANLPRDSSKEQQ